MWTSKGECDVPHSNVHSLIVFVPQRLPDANPVFFFKIFSHCIPCTVSLQREGQEQVEVDLAEQW